MMSEHIARKEAMGAGDDQKVGVKEQGKWKKTRRKKCKNKKNKLLNKKIYKCSK